MLESPHARERKKERKKERLRKPEVIQLGQEFVIFDPQRTYVGIDHNFLRVTRILWEHFGNSGMPPETETTLETQKLLHIPQINLSVPVKFENSEWRDPDSGFTPFDPKFGYQVNDADYDEVAYLEKLQSYIPPEELTSRLPFILSVVAGTDERLGTRISFLGRRATPEKTIDTLSRLRLQVTFPTGLSFEGAGQWGPRVDEFNMLGFWEYYQVGEKEPARNSTHPLRLPKDIDRLTEIKGKFILE